MKKNMKKDIGLKVGDMLYQFASFAILEYKVIEIKHLQTETSEGKHKERFYIVECLSCKDHPNCILALNISETGRITYSHMINNYEYDDDDYYSSNTQYHWHTDDRFFRTRQAARYYIREQNLKSYEKNIKELKEKIKKYEEDIAKTKLEMGILKEGGDLEIRYFEEIE